MSNESVCIAEVISALEEFAPQGLAEGWDAVGLQVGDPRNLCRTVAVALDLTFATLEEAIAEACDLIVTHHPLLFRPVQEIRFDRPLGHLLQRLCAEKIAVYVLHTNLDATVGGLNDFWTRAIELQDVTSLLPPAQTTPAAWRDKIVGLGRVGQLKAPQTLKQLARKIVTLFKPENLRVVGHDHHEVSRIALCTGSGGSMMREAIAAEADCFITGDVKYHQALAAEAAGMAVLDVGHYSTEIIAIEILSKVLRGHFPNQLTIVPLKNVSDPIRPYS